MQGVNCFTKKYLTGAFLVSDSRGGKNIKKKKKTNTVLFLKDN